MSILRMVASEIWHRKLNFLIGLLAIATAVTYAASSIGLIDSHQRQTAERVAALDDEIRKITLAMGFNINVLPAEQNLADFHANDFAGKTMPQDYVNRLAESPIIKSVRHLRPALIRKAEWPEYGRQVVLMGVAGVVPLSHVSNPRPMTEPVPSDAIIVGAVLAKELGLKEGADIDFHGRKLHVQKIRPPAGTKDDITVWIDLAVAQQILGLEGQINLIQALECNCASIDRLAEIQQEISQVLGTDVQVIELATQAIARAKARETVRIEGEQTQAQLERRTTLQMFLLTIAGSLLVGTLALLNVRERQAEIGILRAIGTSTAGILRLFLTKALLMGLLGAGLGLFVGYFLSDLLAATSAGESLGVQWISPMRAVWIATLTPLLTMLASWIPAMLAASADPASILASD